MQCEICGVDIYGSPRKIVVEGTELEVCAKCAQHGKTPESWTAVPQKIAPTPPTLSSTDYRKPKSILFNDMNEMIPDYNKVIREAREAKGLTIEELGLNMKEKASLIRKIERSEIIPEDSVRKKLELALGIKLTERLSNDRMEHETSFRETTLGDIVTIKKKRK